MRRADRGQIFVESNQGGGDLTRIDAIDVLGVPVEYVSFSRPSVVDSPRRAERRGT